VSLKIELDPDEVVVLDEDFKILDDLAAVRFVVSDKAVHVPVLKVVPAGSPFVMRRIPLQEVREVALRKRWATPRGVLGLVQLAAFSSLIIAEATRGFGPMILLWGLGLAFAVREVRNTVGAMVLVVVVHRGKVVSAVPPQVKAADRAKIYSAYRSVIERLRSVGVAVSGEAPA
jgi:hypothetical protein